MTRTIRRSAIRDLPPTADSPQAPPAVTSTPTQGARIKVKTFSGVTIDAVIRDVRNVGDGWIATARMTDHMQLALLRRAGVPAHAIDEDFTVFDWQVI
jgi:hypothetical protein